MLESFTVKQLEMYNMIVDFKQKSQVTIPNEIVKKMHLKVGDKLDIAEKDGRLIITPVVIIPKDQAWYYSEKWQTMEKTVDEQIKNGNVHQVNSKEELYKDLGLDDL